MGFFISHLIMRYGHEHIISSHGFCCTYAIDKNGNVKWTLNVGLYPDFSSYITDHTASIAGADGRRFQLASWLWNHILLPARRGNRAVLQPTAPSCPLSLILNNNSAPLSKGQLPRLVSLPTLNLVAKTLSLLSIACGAQKK